MNIVRRLKIFVKTHLQRLFITMQLYGSNGLANHAAASAYGFLLSMAPMLLFMAIFIFYVFKPSPAEISALIGNIPFLGSMFDENWLSTDYFSLSVPGITSIISILSIIWAGRILALSIQRGLKVIFPAKKDRNPVTDTLVTLAIEISVIAIVLVAIISSRLAMSFYKLIDFTPHSSVMQFVTSQSGGRISYIFLLGLASFAAYLFIPVKSPRVLSAFLGSVFCAVLYFCTAMVLGFILNKARFNLLYGTLGNMIVLLVNVYFFFNFFFLGAQLANVLDSFDALLFSRFRKSKKNSLLHRFYYPSGGNLNKYLRKYKKDDIIFSQGETAKEIFYLLDGEVEILLESSEGDVYPADVIHSGSFFGEMGYLLSEKRTATVRTITDVSVFALPVSLFDAIIKFDHSIDRVLIKDMSRRLKERDEMIINSNPEH
jgi:membrane protein